MRVWAMDLRLPGAQQALRAVGWALLAAVLVSACAEAGRVTALEQSDRAREERLRSVEEQRSALQAQAKALADQSQRLTEQSSRVAGALELAITQLNALAKEQGRRLDALQSEVKTARAIQAAPRAPEQAECRWLGRRAIVLLLRDDPIAAQGFIRIYTDLSCPIEHFAQAFGCAVPSAAVEDKQEARIEQCWANPRGRR